MRQNQQIDRALNDYMNWLTKAEEVIIEEEEREAQERMFIFLWKLLSSYYRLPSSVLPYKLSL